MRKYMGQTPSGFVNAIRLERVAEALTSTDRPIFDIMLDVGFQNTSHFNKLFKDKYHMSPRKYRASGMNILGQTE
jgi:AraC family cel operon transcriptional repressor